jgi:hypothetical protein
MTQSLRARYREQDQPENPGPWRHQAACLGHGDDMEITNVAAHHRQPGIKWCEQCPVLKPCRDWALTEPDPARGLVAGGLTPRQRKAIRKGWPV